MGASEAQHQIAVIKWTQQPEIRAKWPELALLHHVPNERACSPKQGKILKLMGLKRGVPDLCLPVPRGEFAALYIEMKKPISDGGKEPEYDQKWWLAQLNSAGNFADVCYGWQEAAQRLEWYLGLGKSRGGIDRA